MQTYEFEFLLEGPDIMGDDAIDALYEAGCDDGTFGRRDTEQHVGFDREAPSFGEAVLSAIADVEGAVPGLRVIRVEPDELVTMAGIAERAGRTRQSVGQLVAGQRGPGEFPTPVAWVRGRQRLWRWSEVAEWLASAKGERPALDPAAAEFLGALNGLLAARRHAVRLRRLQEEDEGGRNGFDLGAASKILNRPPLKPPRSAR